MKSPNTSNIDQWLFHYFEGDLSANEETMLENFLLENPQYDTQFEAWGAARMNRVDAEFVNRGTLLKPLVSPVLLNKVSVLTAVGINAVLALFIIWGNSNTANNVALEASSLQLFNLGSKNISGFSSSSSKSEFSSEVNRFESQVPSSNSTNLSMTVGLNGFENVSANPNATGSFSIFSTNPELIQENYDDIASANNEFTSSSQIEPELLMNHEGKTEVHGNIETVGLANNDVAETNHSEYSSQNSSQQTSNAASGNSGSSSSNESRDKKSSSRSNRFKGTGDLLLTNSRDIEYLIPGMTRNQVNFGHVASDFSNSIYSNTYFQWPNQSNSLMSNQLGLDLYLPEAKSGVGLQLNYDRYANGAINNVEVLATYAPKFFLTKSKSVVFEPAVRVRLGGTGVNRNLMTPGSLIEFDRSNAFFYTSDQASANVNRSINQDFGLGFLLNTKWGFVGANADNLIGTRNQALHYGSELFLDRMPIFFNAVVGTEYESRSKKFRMSGQMVYQNFGDLNKFWFGSRVKYNSLSLGASVSSAGEPMFSLGWVSRNVSMLYSTDYALSQMTGRKHLSHQLTMRVTLKESRLRKLMLN
jgi:hypothetical protein